MILKNILKNVLKIVELNGNYIETLGRDDELAIVRAKTELDLITKILDEVEKI